MVIEDLLLVVLRHILWCQGYHFQFRGFCRIDRSYVKSWQGEEIIVY